VNRSARKPLVAGNWKMNGTAAAADALIDAVLDGLGAASADVMVIPPFPYLERCRARIGDGPLLLGAQDVSARQDGAFTGEVSASMLADVGAGHVLVGHSERRQFHHEDDELVAAKFMAAQAAGLTPVLCVGETLAQREAGRAEEVIGAQLEAIIRRAGVAALDSAVVAYEPVWAIGTGKTATPDQAEQMHAHIRARIENHDATIAGQIRILYGGSVKPENASALLACGDIDGGLIGGAALIAEDFLAIARAAQ